MYRQRCLVSVNKSSDIGVLSAAAFYVAYAEVLHACVSVPGHAGRGSERVLQSARVAGGEGETGFVVSDEFGDAADAGADDGGLGGEGFQAGVGHVLAPFGGEHAEPGVAHLVLEIVAGLVAQQLDTSPCLRPGLRDQPFDDGTFGAVAHDVQIPVGGQKPAGAARGFRGVIFPG